MRGVRGGWQLEENWRTQVPGLDEAELRALLMAQPRVLGERRLAAAAERALGKLVASLPVPLRARAETIRQRLYVDTTGWRGPVEDLSMLPLVQHAVSNDRKLKIRYMSRRDRLEQDKESNEAKGPTERIVSPLGLVAKRSTWYLVAHTSKGLRTFRVSRIENAALLDLPAERPTNFNLEAYWKAAAEEFLKTLPRFETTLCLHPDAERDLKMWRMLAPSDGVPSSRPGWVAARVQFDDEQQALVVIRGFGPKVEVISPITLRARVVTELGVTQNQYKQK
jgi:predicted DNA-binding transcriptional regulator YafY